CVFQAADEPAYLTVGTDVSAKYRGAFCEAKIKTVKRMVKVKVTLKGESTSQVVQDDQVKGPLRVGSTVEVKTNEGLSSEAVISKLTDASLYTVVFDDGDEKTLRRTSLCLKGERHFAESETLDQLPLTNPEHFGTPVIGKKSNRGGRRSSQAVADEENDTSSSEEEEDDKKRLNDELRGQICSIENVEDSDQWFMALVLSPSCNEELVVKKDQCLVRSFCDGKFYTVGRRHAHVVNTMSISKSDFSKRKGIKEAQMFLRSREVPDVWKMDMSQILDSSSEDDKDDKDSEAEEEEEDAEDEKRKRHIKEEPEEEADPEEKENFLQHLYKFMEDRGNLQQGEQSLFYPSALSAEFDPAHLRFVGFFLLRCFRSEEDEDGDSLAGTKVRVKYGRGKTQKIYEAHIKKTDVDNGEQFYLVHYYGWNVRYDEWVKADRIIWPAEKGTKKRQRKKVKNKDKEEPEKEEEKPASITPVKPPGLKRGRPQIRTTPSGRSVSKTPSSEGQSNGRSVRSEVTPSLANGNDTPRRKKRTPGMYESDQASNEDSGNSSDDSETDNGPEKTEKPSPWRGGSEPQTREPEEEEEEEEPAQPEEQEGETSAPEPADVDDMKAEAASPEVAAPPCPSMPQEEADQPEKQQQQGVEPAVEPSGTAVHLEKNKASPVMRTLPIQDKSRVSPGQEVMLDESLPPERQQAAPSSPSSTAEEESSSPRGKGRRANPRESAPETPPTTPQCNASPAPSSLQVTLLTTPPRGMKRQEEPMVVLRCLPSQHLPTKPLSVNSDTDSATEEEEEEEEAGPKQKSSSPLKRKATDQRTAEKKLCTEDRKEEGPPAPPTVPPLPQPSEQSGDEGGEAEEQPRPEEKKDNVVEEEKLSPCGSAEMHSGTEAQSPPPAEELDPQIGPEALVCHEVDLDDPDEKEKPPSSSDCLLLMMREQNQAPPPLPLAIQPPQPQVRSFLIAAPPTVISEEPHPPKDPAEEERGCSRGEQGGDSSPGFEGSTSSSSSLLFLQENKDRGQKRVNDVNSSLTAKKHKRNQKRTLTPAKADKNGAGHSSDSEDQSRLSSLSKSQKSRCPGLSSPSSHSKDKHGFPSPQRSYKWTLQLDELDSMSSTERISFLQEKLQEIRKYYMSLKSEVASIDRRRKRLKKKEREVSNTTASTSSGSSDTGMSPSSASPAQNTVAVECR
ncbi:PREDICTED: AT-rich interactive domain-containing protein 4A, partial [Cyprinodon variegatus]|uniref:AT-rich interactive domain-containing protein 4A n=1 Tax=Cyprinodon variegatus TaxID=28743 RepID=UPI00074272E1